ncbi:MAG TPA: periplasmic heavy metal sensor [Thermoanaerobaculia bacterium]|nr:periplasmic heavy metal sensor [Thermoanaerobaculia bacterium]
MKNGTSRKGLAAVAAVLGLLLAAGAATAGPAGRRGGASGDLRGALEALDLSDGQRAELKAVLEEGRERREALRRESWDARQALRTAAEAPAPDAAEVGRAYLRLRESRRSNVEAREKTKERIASILTVEQKAKLEELRSRRGAQRDERPGRPGRDRGLRGPRPPVR